MKEFFTISQTAKIAGVTSETLRHYDRIGLVKPCKVDEWTGYRYYSQQEIVRLNTIHALRCMDLSLAEIKEILSYEDFRKITEKLKLAEKKADEKIAELNNAKNRIRRARTFYESKLSSQPPAELFDEAFSAKGHFALRFARIPHIGQFMELSQALLQPAPRRHER